jgi:hypothetical protein
VLRRVSHAGHSQQGSEPHPLRRRAIVTVAVAALLAALALLIAPPHARANFVYWANSSTPGSIGRAKINGTGANNNFITGLDQPTQVAVDSNFIYWSEAGTNRIGIANLDGTHANPNMISRTPEVTSPTGIAVTATGIYWVNHVVGNDTIGHANYGGSSPVGDFFDTGSPDVCGLAADQSFLYWLNTSGSLRIGRAPLSGAAPDPNFITVPGAGCGVAVDGGFIYWDAGGGAIGRVPIGGGTPNAAFLPAAATDTCGVAANPQYLFWGNLTGLSGPNFVGRANINGSSPNPGLIAGAGQPCGLAAAPSNKITVNSLTRKKKKGTAAINAKVPGPGQLTLNQSGTPPDVNATAASVKGVALTIPQASSFTLPIKPQGKTAQTLKRQLKKKRKAKVGVNVFIHFLPAGVAGIPNTQQVSITLVKQRNKK